MVKKLITAAVICAIADIAYCATRCVKSYVSTDVVSWSSEEYRPDWALNMADGGIVRGIAMCSSSTDSVVVDAGGGRICWCKMISPAVSGWVLFMLMDDFEECVHLCPSTCAGKLSVNPNTLPEMFGAIQ